MQQNAACHLWPTYWLLCCHPPQICFTSHLFTMLHNAIGVPSPLHRSSALLCCACQMNITH